MEQFHQHGYVTGEPRERPAAGYGINRPDELPDKMDVLIVGGGPAGHATAAQLAQFPNISTRMIERRGGRLEHGNADGIQARSVETFQAFGFADEAIAEGYHITAMAFWGPDDNDPSRIVRKGMPADDPANVSEFPHLIFNQARVQDYFAREMLWAPTRMKPNYGWEYQDHELTDDPDYPLLVNLRGSAGIQDGSQRSVRTKYLIGCDGAHSQVRKVMGHTMAGTQSMHAWGVMDVLANTDFPDIRTKCAIQSHDAGNILHIPREGGYLYRMYIDLGELNEENQKTIRSTPIEQIIETTKNIFRPYTFDVRHVAWYSVYEVGHRVTDYFDDVAGLKGEAGNRTPRVFITGDACHTHSAKAGQGMNVSMQDGWNIAWKLGHVLDGRSSEELLHTYSGERHTVAEELINFDREWSTLMAKPAEELENPAEVEEFYIRTFEFPMGFMTEYKPSMITGEAGHQDLASGFPIGKRFRSSAVIRNCDVTPQELGHLHLADGRWRIYVFADAPAPGDDSSQVAKLAKWLESDPASPIVRTPKELDRGAWVDLKVIYQQRYDEMDIMDVPSVFKPLVGQYKLVNLENVFSAGTGPKGTGTNIFDERGISSDGAIVVVRPDQYVSAVLPLGATDELGQFFKTAMGG